MKEVKIEKIDETVMKLLHYFITDCEYSPIVLHGAKNEIWLENMDFDFQVVRIVSNYIHNDEQFQYDIYRTSQIANKIKRKTFSHTMKVMNIFLNLGDNVHVENFHDTDNMSINYIKKIDDLKKCKNINKNYPDICEKTKFIENGAELFFKITKDISIKNEEQNHRAEEIFKMKKPVVTYFLIFLNIFVFFLTYLFGNGSTDAMTLVKFGANYAPLVKVGQIYRLFTSAFVHIGIFHLIFNMYVLYIIGRQLESFLGKIKYIIVYLFSAVSASLMSCLVSNNISAGASGAIFGLFGSMLYFGYHYRIYLGNVLTSQIIPLILFNLLFGFMISGVDNAAHIGGLIGGILITIALGLKYKSTNFEKINGWIVSGIYIFFLSYMLVSS